MPGGFPRRGDAPRGVSTLGGDISEGFRPAGSVYTGGFFVAGFSIRFTTGGNAPFGWLE